MFDSPVLLALNLILSIVYPPRIAPGCASRPDFNAPGVLCEDFDTNRNVAPGVQFTRLPIAFDPLDPLLAFGDPDDDILGYTQSTGAGPTGTGGVACALDLLVFRTDATCTAPVAEENDWHLHSPLEGPGAGYDPPGRPGIGAPDGGKAHGGIRSMHWGRHLDANNTSWTDTLRYRQISAFVLDPAISIGPASTLEFWHMISVPDDEGLGNGFIQPGTTFGGGQVQISLLGANGRFEKWRRITPGFNGYDSTIQEGITICEFDPGDDSIAPADETMCDASPMWADLGDINGTDATCMTDTDGNDPAHKDCGAISSCTGGPGCTERGSLGNGVWARSAFDLSPFAGRSARLRFIGSMGGGWSFGTSRSLLEPPPGSGTSYPYVFEADDGWWIDDIVLTDLREGPIDCATDADQDGSAMCVDCDDTNPLARSIPDEATGLVFSSDAVTLTWSPPVIAGGASLLYDTLRSTRAFDFSARASCVESGGDDTRTITMDAPQPRSAFFYLVRPANACPYGAAAVTTPPTARPAPASLVPGTPWRLPRVISSSDACLGAEDRPDPRDRDIVRRNGGGGHPRPARDPVEHHRLAGPRSSPLRRCRPRGRLAPAHPRHRLGRR